MISEILSKQLYFKVRKSHTITRMLEYAYKQLRIYSLQGF